MSKQPKRGASGKKHKGQGGGAINVTESRTLPGGHNGKKKIPDYQPKYSYESSGKSSRGHDQEQQVPMACLDANIEKEEAVLESGNASSAPDVIGDQASVTQMEHSRQSKYNCTDKQLLTKSSITLGFEVSDICACAECKHENLLLKEIIDTHPQSEYYVQKLKEQRSAHAMKSDEQELETSEGLPADAAESKQKPHIVSDQKHSSQYLSSDEKEAISSEPFMQSGCDTATENLSWDCDEDDDKMDTCGAVERKGSSEPSEHTADRWYEFTQQESDERGRSGDRQQMKERRDKQMNERRDKGNHGRQWRESNYKKGSQGDDSLNWRKQDNRSRHHDADDRGGRGGSMKNYKKIKEVDGDLFEAPKEYSLAHCVAADMRMGSGIAVNFRQTFKRVPDLLQQQAYVGQIAVLEHEDRFIYYLVTKMYSYEKPSLDDLVSSLKEMRDHCAKHGVNHLAMPRIGCGLDRLEWRNVKSKIEDVFSDLDISITVYNLNQPEKDDDSHYPRSKRYLRIKHVCYRLVDIDHGTALVFFGSEDGGVDECGKNLDHKFNFLPEYRKQHRTVGGVIQLVKKDEVLYGLIVRKKQDDTFSYNHFAKCLSELRKLVKKENFWYIGVEAFYAEDDPLITEKIITVMKNVLATSELELYVCWPKEFEHLHRWDEEMRS